MCHDELCVCTHDDDVVVVVGGGGGWLLVVGCCCFWLFVVCLFVWLLLLLLLLLLLCCCFCVVVLAKLNLTPGGLGLVALRLGPEEMAAQVSYLEGGKNPLQDIGLPSEFRSSYSSCSLEAKSFPWFRKGRRVSQKAKHEI